MQGLRTKLTAIAPTADGEMTLVVEFRLECGSLRGLDAIKKQRSVYVGADGSYSADVKTSDIYGGVRKVAIHLRGRFTGEAYNDRTRSRTTSSMRTTMARTGVPARRAARSS